MKQIVRYRFLTIPGKITGEIRITIDERAAEYSSTFEGGTSTNISLYPVISINLLKPSERDDSGNRIKAGWNPNDSIGMTKYTMPVFIREISGIEKDMHISDLYTYRGDRLELNQSVAEKIRRVFMIGNTTIELSAVVIINNDDQQFEGVKIKFNNEQSTVMLTINELTALVYNLDHLDVDNLVLNMYRSYCNPSVKNNTSRIETDIVPPVKKQKQQASDGLIKLEPQEFQD